MEKCENMIHWHIFFQSIKISLKMYNWRSAFTDKSELALKIKFLTLRIKLIMGINALSHYLIFWEIFLILIIILFIKIKLYIKNLRGYSHV